jgi:multisubunit Na+/H+ antiporter MnhB subunit
MEFRRQWLNYILRKSSELYYVKQRLLVVHGGEAFKLLLRVWWLELKMALASFPIFLFLQTSEVPQKEQHEYRLRRALTLAILIPLGIVWMTRLGIWVVFEVGNASHNFSEGPNQGFSGTSSALWQQVSLATQYTRFTVPTITTSTRPDEIVGGQTEPSGTVVIVLQKRDAAGAISFLQTAGDTTGRWGLSRARVSDFVPGNYQASVIAYESARQLKSMPSPSIPILLPFTWWQRFEQLTDVIIYGTIGLLIMLAIIMSFLNF